MFVAVSACAGAGSGGPEPNLSPDIAAADDDLSSEQSVDSDNGKEEVVAPPEDTQPELDTPPEDTQPPVEPEKYLGGWIKADCADEITGTGNKAGQIAHDFSQMDQYGETLRLYDFCDRHVLLVGSAWW
jgi:hypothetical protein